MKYSFIIDKLPKGKTVVEYDSVFGKEWELVNLGEGKYSISFNAETESQAKIRVAIFTELKGEN